MAHAGLVIMLSALAGLLWQITGIKWAGGNQLVRIFTNFKLLLTPLMTCIMKNIAMSLYLLCMKNGNSWRRWAGRETALIKNKELWLTWKFAHEAKRKVNAFRFNWLYWVALLNQETLLALHRLSCRNISVLHNIQHKATDCPISPSHISFLG